tara:strand:- start:156 stop:548 length:393 start_codon:yes stop_codon:yes gene_type:complete
MFRYYQRWGATPRLELDPGFRFTPSHRWVGELRGLDANCMRQAVALDIARASGMFVGQGLVEAPSCKEPTACTLEGEDRSFGQPMLLWLHRTDTLQPLEIIGGLDAAQTTLSGEWDNRNGSSGFLVLRRI